MSKHTIRVDVELLWIRSSHWRFLLALTCNMKIEDKGVLIVIPLGVRQVHIDCSARGQNFLLNYDEMTNYR
jgi:hypothetical protein